MKLEKLENKKILILGFGKEGIDALRFFKKRYPKKLIAVADKDKKIKKEKHTIYHLGENYLNSLKNYDVIVKSPGIPLHRIKPLVKKSQTITSPTDIFLNNCRGLIIGVTGTKGKSTTCQIIYEILKDEKLRVHLIGNIGKPGLKHLLKNDPLKIYVYELSSFQLATATKSPDISIVINIFKDHLDHHKNFKEYTDSKKRIFKFQKEEDFLIYNKTFKNFVQGARSEKIPFNPDDNNAELFLIIGEMFQISSKKIKEKIKKIDSLPHRMELLGNYKGVTFYNDSAATIPEATINAISKLKVETIIIGGLDKGFDVKKIIEAISQSKIKNIIYFPDTGTVIAKKIRGIKKINIFPAGNMKQAVSLAYEKTQKNKVCLLSPGAASFNMFKNYKQRGLLFKRYVKKLSEK